MKYFENIDDLNRYYNFGNSKHPLIDIRTYSDTSSEKDELIKLGFYKIGVKKNFNSFVKYGKTEYDSTTGIIYCIEPEQIFSWHSVEPWDGYHIFIHPDIFKENNSNKKIIEHNFFSYEIKEALFFTENEEHTISQFVNKALEELNKGTELSISLILSNITSIANIIEKSYKRQKLQNLARKN